MEVHVVLYHFVFSDFSYTRVVGVFHREEDACWAVEQHMKDFNTEANEYEIVTRIMDAIDWGD